MAATITAARTADAGAPQVGVTVAGLSTSTATAFDVDVSWDGGGTWQGVRGGSIVGALGSAFIRDFVCPLNVAALYRMAWVSGPLFYSRTNWANNPSVETGTTGWTGWAGSGGAATFAQASRAWAGTKGFQGSWTTAPTSGGGVVYDSGNVLSGPATYTLSMYVYSSAAVVIAPIFQWYAGSTATGSGSGSLVSVPAATWTRISVTASSAAGDNRVQLRAYVQGAGIPAGGTVTGDAVLIESGSQLQPYFDGDTSGDPVYTYAWSGTAHASYSSQYANQIISAPVTVTSPQAWIQDPLNPSSAVPVAGVRADDSLLLVSGTAETITRRQAADLAQVLGADLPVASLGVRQKPSGIPLHLRAIAATQGALITAMASMLDTAGQLVIRGLPPSIPIDPVVHVIAPDVQDSPVVGGLLGPRRDWVMTLTQTRPTTLRVAVPWWTYDQVKALVQAQVSPTATYDQVVAAMPAGKTYTDWLATPGVV